MGVYIVRMLNKVFKLEQAGTNIRTEIIGGILPIGSKDVPRLGERMFLIGGGDEYFLAADNSSS